MCVFFLKKGFKKTKGNFSVTPCLHFNLNLNYEKFICCLQCKCNIDFTKMQMFFNKK